MRKVGMLMPVASLPGRHGIGDFGKESYNFVDLLKEAKAATEIHRISHIHPVRGMSSILILISCVRRDF